MCSFCLLHLYCYCFGRTDISKDRSDVGLFHQKYFGFLIPQPNQLAWITSQEAAAFKQIKAFAVIINAVSLLFITAFDH